MKAYGRRNKIGSYPSKTELKNHQNCSTCYPDDINKKRERRNSRKEIMESTVEVTNRI